MGVSQPYPLTDTLIDKLQNYYGIAIRSNCGNLEGMKAAIYASIIHCVSSKKRNLHTWCLDGPDSWCRLILTYIGKKYCVDAVWTRSSRQHHCSD